MSQKLCFEKLEFDEIVLTRKTRCREQSLRENSRGYRSYRRTSETARKGAVWRWRFSSGFTDRTQIAIITLCSIIYLLFVEMAEGRASSEYPDTLQGFGYGFNKDGKLRKLHPDTNELGDEGFEFCVTDDHQKNQRHYEALGEVVTKYVYELLETEGQLQRLDVPISDDKVKSSDSDKIFRSFIFVSKDALSNPERLLILIHGSGVVRAGQWARSLIINDSLKTGSQLTYIHRARELGYGVMILNTNDNSRTIEGRHYKIKNSEDPHKHAQYVWETYIRKAKARHLAIVAHSYGGSVVIDLMKQYFDEFRKRVTAVAFTDSTHFMSRPNAKVMYYLQKTARNWVASKLPLDTVEETSSKDVPRVSAGTPKHELTSAAAFESVFDFVEQHFNLVSSSHEL